MRQRRTPGTVKVESIFHPSDFSEASEIAFVHALKIALITQARLSMLHVTAGSNVVCTRHVGALETDRSQPCMEAAVRLIRNFQLSAGTVTLLHVGSASGTSFVRFPETPGWTWNCVARTGDPVETILETTAELVADLIVMTTDGPDGFLDGLCGTTSERVLRQARCPCGKPTGGIDARLRQ